MAELASLIRDRTLAARTPAPTARAGSSARGGGAPTSARFSTVLVKTPFGQRLFRTAEGQLMELPEEISDEEFYKTQAEVKAAEAQLGKGPAPKPVPPVDKQANKKEPKKEKLRADRKGRPGKGRGKAAAAGAAAAAALKVAGRSKVAQYLVGKAMPVLRKGAGMLARLSTNEQTHDAAAQKRQQAEQAVVIPESENQAKSSGHQVTAVGARPAPPVDESRGQSKLQESLRKNVPKKIEDVDNFKRDKKAQHMGADVMQVVTGDKNAVVSTFADMGQTPPPAPPEHTPEELPPQEVAPSTPAMNLGQGAVAPLQPEHTDVSKYTKEGDAKLKEEGVTQEQLDMVDSGELADANKEKKGMEKTATTEPLAIQKFGQQEAAKIDGDLKQDEKKERNALTAKRKNQLGATGRKQKTAKSALEKKREEVAAKINSIYKAVQDKVKKKLADLETQSMKRFDDGNDKATKKFEDNVKRDIDAFKADRYSGFFGWARRARDWLKGIDDLPAVKAIFDRNRAAFVATIDKLVADISADNKRVIQECKDDLANAKKEIKDYVDKLGPALKDIGKQAAEEMNGKLAELDKFVGKKEEELQQKLADKQKAAIQAIDQKIEKMKEAMAGALAKLGKLLLWAAKKLFTWALKKFGYSLEEIQGIIDKGVAVLKAIFTKPIVFVKNLMNAAITGFKNFGKNFLKHLKDALFEWLTGSLEGIKLPTTWDLKGIVGLALQMIGISYQNIRRHMVAVMGEPVVAGLEKGFALVKTLITEGPMAAWEQLKDMAKDMQDAFIDAVKDFIKTKIIEQAIIWLVSLFIPGAGIVKAVIGIYDTVVFFIKKAKQIAKMIANFLSSIGEIAAGNIGAAAEAMETGLARGLSLVISFLAALLRLSGVTAKIRDAIQKVRGKVDDVLLKVAKWIADKAKKLFGAVKAGVKKALGWWKREQKFSADGEQHRFFIAGDAKSAQLRVASDEKSLKDFVAGVARDKKNGAAIDAIVDAQAEIEKLRKQRKPPTSDERDPMVDDKIDKQFDLIASELPKLFTGDAWGTETNPLLLHYPKKSASLYRTLYLGPRVSGRLAQSILQARLGDKRKGGGVAAGFDKNDEIKPAAVSLDAWIAKGGVVRAYKPFSPAPWPDGETHKGSATLGVAPQFLAQVGTSFNYEKGTTPGGKKLNEPLKKFGFYGRKDGGENSDGDHILEAQLIGRDSADQIPNMWPLDKTENRHGENLETKADVEVAGQPKLKFKGLGAALTAFESKGSKKNKSKSLRVLIKSTVETK